MARRHRSALRYRTTGLALDETNSGLDPSSELCRFLDQSQRTPECRRIPRDAFFASGDLCQRTVIMPSQHLVVVRLGDSVDPTGEIRGLGRLVKEVMAAKP